MPENRPRKARVVILYCTRPIPYLLWTVPNVWRSWLLGPHPPLVFLQHHWVLLLRGARGSLISACTPLTISSRLLALNTTVSPKQIPPDLSSKLQTHISDFPLSISIGYSHASQSKSQLSHQPSQVRSFCGLPYLKEHLNSSSCSGLIPWSHP